MQDEIEEEGTLSKFKLKTFDANEKVKDAKLEKLKEEMGLDDTGNYMFSQYKCFQIFINSQAQNCQYSTIDFRIF